MWLDKPEQWSKLAEALRAAGEFGLDTETYGQPDGTSPQHRARIHCWSVGVLTTTQSPRGYRRAVGRVLPAAALRSPELRSVLADGRVRKWAHNAPHDRHALNNEGIEVVGLEDSLQWLRVAVPGMRDYGLKGAEQWALGYGPRPGFRDMMTYEAEVVTARRRRERGCICGKTPCHARQVAEWWDQATGWWRPHTRVSWSVFTPVTRKELRWLEVPQFVPGAVLPPLVWQGLKLDRLAAWWEYSLADAVRGIELVDWCRNVRPRKLEYPWRASSCPAF
jgi:hypothetical protein